MDMDSQSTNSGNEDNNNDKIARQHSSHLLVHSPYGPTQIPLNPYSMPEPQLCKPLPLPMTLRRAGSSSRQEPLVGLQLTQPPAELQVTWRISDLRCALHVCPSLLWKTCDPSEQPIAQSPLASPCNSARPAPRPHALCGIQMVSFRQLRRPSLAESRRGCSADGRSLLHVLCVSGRKSAACWLSAGLRPPMSVSWRPGESTGKNTEWELGYLKDPETHLTLPQTQHTSYDPQPHVMKDPSPRPPPQALGERLSFSLEPGFHMVRLLELWVSNAETMSYIWAVLKIMDPF